MSYNHKDLIQGTRDSILSKNFERRDDGVWVRKELKVKAPKRFFKRKFIFLFQPLFETHFTDQLICSDDGYKYHRSIFGLYSRGSKIRIS